MKPLTYCEGAGYVSDSIVLLMKSLESGRNADDSWPPLTLRVMLSRLQLKINFMS